MNRNTKPMLGSTLILSFAATCLIAADQTLDLTGPDGSVRFRLATDPGGHLVYSISSHGQSCLESAPAGVIIDNADFGAAVKFGTPKPRSISEVFPWRGNKTSATNQCQASEIPVQSAAGDWTLEVRVFNNGAGFRYWVPGSGNRRVQGESTCWQLPRDATVWFQSDTGGYEGVYQSARADRVPLEEEVQKKRRAVHLGAPMTAVFADGTFGLISEASLYNYSGLTLRPEGGARFRAAFEDDPQGWSHDGPILSPWRVIVLGKDLNDLVNSDVIPALCDPPDPKLFPDGPNTAWIKPGKAPCTWMVYGNDGAQWDRQKWFVDVSAATGCEYLLVDAGWRSEKWGWLKNDGDLWARAAELCRYAAERNVGIVLWHAYPDGRNDGIREQEYVLWDSLPLAHYGALPFTRMAAGHADFLPGYVQPRLLKNTTTIFQMACVLVFSSPFLCWPDNPEAYLDSPLLQFVRTVPVTWDETRILSGSVIGDTVIMARRKGAEWYVAVLNCRSEARTLELGLSGLDLAGKELTLYRDGPTSPGCQIESGVKPPADGKLSIALQPGGGFIAHVRPPKTFAGWK